MAFNLDSKRSLRPDGMQKFLAERHSESIKGPSFEWPGEGIINSISSQPLIYRQSIPIPKITKMVSVAPFISLLCALVAISRAEQVTNGQSERHEARWLGGFGMGMAMGPFFSGFNLGLNPWLWNWVGPLGGCYGYSLFGGMLNNMLFVKATDDATSVSRRAISLDADQLYRRAPEKPVSCINEKGATRQFLKSDCLKAANQLAEKKISSASHGSCTLSLVSPKDRVAPKQIPGHELEKAVDGIMKACSTRRSAKPAKRAATSNNSKDVALVLSKPHH